MSERCRWFTEDGVKICIPGCMGVAAAFGCGKTDADIKSYCTCPPRRRSDKTKGEQIEELQERVNLLTVRVAELESG